MIDYISEVKPLEGELSDAQISAHLNAKTAGAMQPELSAYILSDTGAVLSSPADGSRFGSLIDHYAVADDDAKNLIAFFIERILDSKQEVSTNEYPRSIQFQSVCASFPAELQGVCDQLVEAAGGRPHSDVTEADVVQSRTDWEAAEAARIEAEQQAQAEAEAEQLVNQQLLELESRYSQLYNQFIASALIDQRVVDEAAWVSGIQAMADNFVE
jgi:hypothetical protein|tara:strand:- start:117 stop:758 length:642 start_codon:yes stop_codon:yes gene_type:complete